MHPPWLFCCNSFWWSWWKRHVCWVASFLPNGDSSPISTEGALTHDGIREMGPSQHVSERAIVLPYFPPLLSFQGKANKAFEILLMLFTLRFWRHIFLPPLQNWLIQLAKHPNRIINHQRVLWCRLSYPTRSQSTIIDVSVTNIISFEHWHNLQDDTWTTNSLKTTLF